MKEEEGMELAPSAIPKHLKEDPDDDSISPASTRPSSPTSAKAPPKHSSSIIIPTAVPGKLQFPTAPDLNTRLRRLVAAYQREHKKRQLKEQKREKKEQVKMMRMQEQLRQRELRKIENAQKWSRREEADFYRILTAFGVDQGPDPEAPTYRWDRFKRLAKLDRKYDERMTEFYEHYHAMCLRVCKREEEIPEGYAASPLPENFTIEPITEERASKCLARIDLLHRVRTQIVPHPDLAQRLTKCRPSMELPDWWELGRHDQDLITGVCRYGINRQESQHAMINDEELCFKELKEKFPEAARAMPVPMATSTTPGGPMLSPFQRKPGHKKPGPKKGVPRKKRPIPPGGGPEAATPSTGGPPAVGGDGGVGGGMRQGEEAPMMGNGDAALKDEDHYERMGEKMDTGVENVGEEGIDDRTRGSEETELERMEEGGNEEQSEFAVKEDSEPRPDSADIMSQDANSINEDLDEGLGSGNDDSSDDEKENGGEIKPSHKDDEGDPNGSSQNSELLDSVVPKMEPMDYDLIDEVKPDAMKFEPSSPSNSFGTSADGDEEKPPLSMLQQVLMKGTDSNHIPSRVKEEGEEGKGGPPSKAAKQGAKKKDTTPKVVVPTFRWPKDRVIVHRLEQLSHLVLKNEWPGGRRHHHPPPPPMEGAAMGYDDPDGLGAAGPRGGLEHNYAGGMSMGRKRAGPALNPDGTVKKKKKKKKPMSDEQRAAQFATLMRQNQAMMAAFTAGGGAPGALPPSIDPSSSSAAIAALASNTPPQSTHHPNPATTHHAPPPSSYHIHDTVFKAVPDFVREGRGPAEGRVVGVLDLSGKGMVKKKKKKVKVQTVRIDGKLVKIKKPVESPSPLKQLKKKKKKHKHKPGMGSGLSTDQATSTAASESQESQDDGAMGKATPSSPSPVGKVAARATPNTPSKKRKRLKSAIRLDESSITGEEKVGMISRESGKRLAGKHCPVLNNLSDWLARHPTYDVALEWGNIVKTKGYLREELQHRIASGKSRTIPIKPAPSPGSPGASGAQLTLGALQGSTIGSIAFPATFTGLGVGQVMASATALSPPKAASISPRGGASPKKKKKKVSLSPTTTAAVKTNILPRQPTTITVDATAASQLAGISPFLLPNTGNVFFSPFLAQQGVLQAGGSTVTITTPATPNAASATPTTASAPAASPGGVAKPTIKLVGGMDRSSKKRTPPQVERKAALVESSMRDSDDSDSSEDEGNGALVIGEMDDTSS